MSSLWSNDWFVIPAFGASIFAITYLWADRIINFLRKKSLGRREDIIHLLKQMFVEMDERNSRNLTIAMLLSSFGTGALVFIIFWPNLILGTIAGGVLTLVGFALPHLVVKSIYERRCTRFVDQMVDGMTIMANGIKAGLSVTQSMERVVDNMPNPIRQEFGLVLSEMQIGRSLEESLNDLGTRIPRPDVQMFVTSVNILQETGGNLAETFQTIVYTVRERQKVEKKIEALTAQGVTQGIIITLVPFALLAIFMVIDPTYVRPLFTTTLGIIILMGILALQVIGGLMIRKIVKINV